MGTMLSTQVMQKTTQDATAQPDTTMVDVTCSDAKASPSPPSLLDLPPELRVMIYGFVLKDFEITATDMEERDLAVPLLNVSRSIAEEALDTYKERIHTSKQRATKELRTAVENLCTRLRTENLPELDLQRQKITICEEELMMIAEVKNEYRMK